MSRRALLTGTVGGIIGAITSAFGIIWIIILGVFSNEISFYLNTLSYYFIHIQYPGLPLPYIPTEFPIPYYPSASLFGSASLILAVFLIVTSVLIGVGFYGMHKIGVGATSVVGLIFGIMGMTAGALLIIVGNLTTGYMYASVLVEMASVPFYPVPTPNFLVMWIGFIILGITFLVLGIASIHVREMTEKPSAFYAAGALSILCSIVFIIGGLLNIIGGRIIGGLLNISGFTNRIGEGTSLAGIYIPGFGLIFVAFILWAWVFYSSRNK